MSTVTDVIITCGIEEDAGSTYFPAIHYLNEYLEAEGCGALSRLSGHEGGYKVWQCEVFGGAFNNLEIDKFAAVLASAPWRQPEKVVLLIKGEHDEAMEAVKLNADFAYNAEAGKLLDALGKLNLAKPQDIV